MAWQHSTVFLVVFFSFFGSAKVEAVGHVGWLFIGGLEFEGEGFGISGGGKVEILHLGLPLVLDWGN